MFSRSSELQLSTFQASIDNVEKVHAEMTDEQKAELKSIIAEIQRVQEVITERLKQTKLDEICRCCQGACCGSGTEEILMPEEYLLFLFLSLENDPRKEEIMHLLRATNLSVKCRFSHERCVLPSNSMPPICKSHFCNVKKEAEIISAQSRQILDIKFRDFHLALLKQGIRLVSEFGPY